MNGTDSTTSVTGWDNNSTETTITYTFSYNNWEYEPDYLNEEMEAVRAGWYNPRKINLITKYIPKTVNIQIRNKLPHKVREGRINHTKITNRD